MRTTFLKGTTGLDPVEHSVLAQALNQLWARFLPQIEERVAILESAASAFTAGQLSAGQSAAASSAAHKLAGVLGTFGLARGTDLGRELEIIYSREGGPDPALGERIVEITARLRDLIEDFK
jgi:HPt (histidine-containing phosphotransfer) domain-containing protein